VKREISIGQSCQEPFDRHTHPSQLVYEQSGREFTAFSIALYRQSQKKIECWGIGCRMKFDQCHRSKSRSRESHASCFTTRSAPYIREFQIPRGRSACAAVSFHPSTEKPTTAADARSSPYPIGAPTPQGTPVFGGISRQTTAPSGSCRCNTAVRLRSRG
jgi:hypothetical protein